MPEVDERHEKALEAAEEMMEYGASFGEALKAYLDEAGDVIVPREPTEEMIDEACCTAPHVIITYTKPEERNGKIPLIPFATWRAMLSKAPNHFTNGE